MIDFAVMEQQHPNKFLEREIHGMPTVYFDRGRILAEATTQVPQPDFDQRLAQHLRALIERFRFFHCLVHKELQRGHFLDALSFYQRMVLQPLVVLVRVEHAPFQYNFGIRYLYRDFPTDVIQRLEALHAVVDAADLAQKYQQAQQWFEDMAQTLETTFLAPPNHQNT